MKRRLNTCNLLTSIVALILTTGCLRPPVQTVESPAPEAESSVPARGFDPLDLARDREIVPAIYPREGVIVGSQSDMTARTDKSSDSLLSRGEGVHPVFDSSNSQVYRVQIFTGLVHGEARQVARVAEEIFDQPVYVDYEVPNYKVRVGDWAGRDMAERYRQKARTVGYANAWVVMVSINVREAESLYDDRTALPQTVSETPEDSVRVTDEDGSVDD